MTSHNASRRLFLTQSQALAGLGLVGGGLGLQLAALGSASAQTAPGYKALVCIFLFGGNDAYNMFLPTDAASWANYSTTRNQAPDSIALLAPGTAANATAAVASPARLGGVLGLNPVTAQSRTFALHPVMSGLQTLFNTNRRLAILPNIGPLILPTTKAQYSLAQSTHPKPKNLFSHNDQQSTWQTLAPEGATLGWGGLIADRIAAANGQSTFTAISASGNAVFLSGQTTRQYQVGTNGALRMGADSAGRTFGSTEITAALERVVNSNRGIHPMEQDFALTGGRAIAAEASLRTTLPLASASPFGTAPATGTYNPQTDPRLMYNNPLTGGTSFNSLAQQLQIVARMISSASTGGIQANRQVFFVSMGGFDTHDAQNRSHADLFAKLSHAMSYFDATLSTLGLNNSVTTFTASDFGRTFTSNGDGTDHGWGSHHMVMGGAVKGGEVYGTIPVLGTKNANNNNFDNSPDQIGNGAMLPTTSVDQLGATLGRWMGVGDSDVASIFPNLNQWNASQRFLGFL